MMNSSVSTIVCGNLASREREPRDFLSETDSDIVSTHSSVMPTKSSLPYSSTSSAASRPLARSSVFSGVSTASSSILPSRDSVASIPEHEVASQPSCVSSQPSSAAVVAPATDQLKPKNPPKTTYGTGGRRRPWAGLSSMFPSDSAKSGEAFDDTYDIDIDEILQARSGGAKDKKGSK